MKFCHSCLKTLRDTHTGMFCRSCSKKLFNLNSFDGFLDFDPPELRSTNEECSRISISGAQVKFSARVVEKKIEKVDKEGTHILKPSIDTTFTDYLDIPANEHVTMQMARQIFNIRTAESALLYFKSGEPIYITKRFDVQEDGLRSIQEDFAQIAGLSEEKDGPRYKYEAISYEGIANLIQNHVSASEITLEQFFRILLFNYLVCNGDAHCKNFSLYRQKETDPYLLTPAYDLMNTSLHVQDEPSRTALDLFKDEDDFATEFYKANGFYGAPDFMEFAKRIGIKEARATKFIQRTIDAVPAMEQMLDNCFLSHKNKEKYKMNIRDRAKALS